jgi:molybdate transport system regulatory protein
VAFRVERAHFDVENGGKSLSPLPSEGRGQGFESLRVRHFQDVRHAPGIVLGGSVAIQGPLKLSFQLLNGEAPAIGPGKALVMEAIDREGSISAAGRALGMSYRRIWLLAESLNTDWQARVIDTRVGGGKSGGAQLTDFGRQLLTSYRAIEARMMAAAAGDDLDWLLDARAVAD